MATVKVLLYNHQIGKKSKSGKTGIYIRIIHNRKPKYISLGIKVDPEKDWDKKRQRVKPSYPNSARVNKYIATKLAEAESKALDLATNSKSVSAFKIKEDILGKPSGDFIEFSEQMIKRLYQAEKERTAIRYKSIINKLKRFLDGRPFTFEDLNVPFLYDYEAHLKSLGNDVNTVHTNLKTLRAILYTAIREDRFPQEKNPFFKFKLKKAPVKKERLTMDEINKLGAIELEKDTFIFHTRNAFLFSFYCAGIRVGDLLQLKWKNVSNSILDYQMGKTKQFRRIKIVRQAQAILDLYNVEDIDLEDYIFPFMDKNIDYPSNSFFMRRLASRTTTINANLKKLATKAKINKRLTSHIARHSFADIARKKGMKLYDISKALGHSSLSITEQYLADFDDTSVDDALDSLFA